MRLPGLGDGAGKVPSVDHPRRERAGAPPGPKPPKFPLDRAGQLKFGYGDMKIITLTLISLIAATCAGVQAQAIKEADLPAEEQGKFKAAKDAAYKSGDADLKQKNLDYKQTFREEMVKADPSIFPLLDKVFPVSGKTQMKVDELPAADAERYKAAQKAARKANPAIKEKQQAAQQALRAVMLKIDPSIGPIVDKVYPPTTASESDAGSSE